jgi:hypothetical protein
MAISKTPIDFLPNGSYLSFIRQTTVGSNKKAMYICVCGTKKELIVNNVKRGKIKSCGCMVGKLQIKSMGTHGLTKTPLYRVWADIKTRCYNQKRDSYKYYGGIGVTMCDEWLNNFESFKDWAISNGWEEGKQIDKDIIPRKMGVPATQYSPGMCTIASPSENSNSRKSNHLINFNGRTQTVTQWERELGFPEEVILQRLKRGWDIYESLSTPILKGKNKHTYAARQL